MTQNRARPNEMQKRQKCRMTFADYLRTTDSRTTASECRVFTIKGGILRSQMKPRDITAQKRSIPTDEADERVQQESRPEPKGQKDGNRHQKGVREARELFDLQSQQLSKLVARQNRGVEVDNEQNLASKKAWYELLQPTEAIVTEIQNELTSRR